MQAITKVFAIASDGSDSLTKCFQVLGLLGTGVQRDPGMESKGVLCVRYGGVF